jgi:CMP-2-keto-3-deoxyoctulosonic acid synthetase
MLQAIYNINQTDVDDKDCVKAVINNDNVIWITRTPEPEWIINRHIFGISGLYVYDYDTIANFRSYDLKMVEDCASLDTLGFIGKIPVTPFNIGMRTHAVDRPSDIEIVKHEIRR